MTLWQEIALRMPALLAEETMWPQLAHHVHDGTLVLSVDAGYE